MKSSDALRRKRIEDRRDKLALARAAVRQRAQDLGIEVRVFGSCARDRINPWSDLDIILVSGFTIDARFRIAALLEEAALPFDVPVDLAYADLSPHLLKDSVLC